MEKVRSLALIELTALFDQNNLVFNRRKPTKRKTKGTYVKPIFHQAEFWARSGNFSLSCDFSGGTN
jgi:hypothetical protein